MPDLVSSVQIVATDGTGAAYQSAIANSEAHTAAVQAGAEQFARIRTEQEAVEAAWIEAIEENTVRAAAAEEARAAAAAKAATQVNRVLLQLPAEMLLSIV